FLSRERHCRNSSTRRRMFSFCSSDNLIEQATVMAKHPSVPTTAQSGARRIGVSVKILASSFARKSLAKTLAKTPFRGPDDQIQRGTSLYGPTNFKFCYSCIYSGLRNT